jgi:sugar transferase EpsL
VNLRRFDRLKRAIDVAGALTGGILAIPLVVGVAAISGLVQGRPILFRQDRPGRGERMFTLYKFRTMTDARNPRGELLSDEERLTRFGRCLRRTSLDEIPELFNVLRGDMSLVGPRPLLAHYLPRYSPTQARRHEVRPGLTGYAQIHGRNALAWEDRLELDVWYVDHRSLSLDLEILLRTLPVVLRGRGVSAEGHATVPEFKSGPGSRGAGS